MWSSPIATNYTNTGTIVGAFSIHSLRELRDIALDCTVASDEPLNIQS